MAARAGQYGFARAGQYGERNHGVSKIFVTIFSNACKYALLSIQLLSVLRKLEEKIYRKVIHLSIAHN